MESKHAELPSASAADDLLPVGPAAKIIGVHAQTLRNYEAAGLIKCFRTAGGERRFLRGDLLAFRESPPPLGRPYRSPDRGTAA